MTLLNCLISGQAFEISAAERDYCARHKVPLPQISPLERFRNMLVFRNRPYLYRTKCGLSGQSILSCIPPESGLTVYDIDAWQGDGWDAKSFGRPYDFSRPFFEQFYELLRQVPWPNLAVLRSSMENSDYTNGITGAKNSYLLFSSSYNEDCLFSFALWRSRSCVDCCYLQDCELCYASSALLNCYRLRFAEHCDNCFDSSFLYNCQSCRNCYRCAGLSHREYCFENQQLSRVDYEKRLVAVDLGSRQIQERELQAYRDFRDKQPGRTFFGRSNEGSTGNFIFNTKNCHNCFFVSHSEDLADCLYLDGARSSILHAMYGDDSELVYNSVTVGGGAYDLRFCMECWSNVSALEYCHFCGLGSNKCFGSVGLRRSSYCILNRQYSKEEYEDLTARIRRQMQSNGEWGRFFPPAFAPFYYNESDAGFYLPLARRQAQEWGFKWRDEAEVAAADPVPVPDHITTAGDELLSKQFCCQASGKAFRLVKAELDFYRQERLALPTVAPLERIRRRLGLFELRPLKKISCAGCQAQVPSAYDQTEQPLYCESCMAREIFG